MKTHHAIAPNDLVLLGRLVLHQSGKYGRPSVSLQVFSPWEHDVQLIPWDDHAPLETLVPVVVPNLPTPFVAHPVFVGLFPHEFARARAVIKTYRDNLSAWEIRQRNRKIKPEPFYLHHPGPTAS